MMFDLSTTETVLAVLVTVLGTARLTRIVAHDDFPPAIWLRAQAEARLGESWAKIVACIWCTQPYIAAICMVWGYFSDLHWTWWAFWGWMALSQAGSTSLAYDEPA